VWKLVSDFKVGINTDGFSRGEVAWGWRKRIMRKLHSSYFSLNSRALAEASFAQWTDTKFQLWDVKGRKKLWDLCRSIILKCNLKEYLRYKICECELHLRSWELWSVGELMLILSWTFGFLVTCDQLSDCQIFRWGIPLCFYNTMWDIQGDQEVSVHLMITIQKVTSNVQSVPCQSPDIQLNLFGSRPPGPGGH
jgi:hypothetical protein